MGIYLSLIATDRDIETKPNEVYGLVSGQTTRHHDREIYEALIMMHVMYTIQDTHSCYNCACIYQKVSILIVGSRDIVTDKCSTEFFYEKRSTY